MEYFEKRYHPPGTAPGTLHGELEEGAVPYKIALIDYTEDEFVERDLASPAECQAFLARATITWIDVSGQIDATALRELGDMFGLHHLALEDVLNTGQRSKIEGYDDQLFMVMACPHFKDGRLTTEQVSVFVGENFIVSFRSHGEDGLNEVRKRLRSGSSRIRKQKVDYLVYAVLDAVIDEGFPVLERFGEELEDLEDELLAKPSHATLEKIHQVKRELLLLRKALWPQREVVNTLLREDWPLVRGETRLYLRDCYDHTVQIMDLIETYRDMTASMLDVYLSSVSNHLNEVMKVLTIIATIFIPLTFIVGVYGMNFSVNTRSPWAMPELRWDYGYPLIWLVMLAVAGGLLLFFKRKKWF